MVLGCAALFICIVSFVFQTAITSRVQKSFAQPYFILWVSHSFWIIMLPLHTAYEKMKRNSRSLATLKQEVVVSCAKLIVQKKQVLAADEASLASASASASDYQRIEAADYEDEAVNTGSYSTGRSDETRANVRNVFKVADNDSDSLNNDDDGDGDGSGGRNYDESRSLALNRPGWVLLHTTALATMLVGLLNASAYLWYVAVGFTSMSKVTATYNMSCFFAYLFSVLLLKERVRLVKCIAVVLSIVGVVFMTLVNSGPNAQDKSQQQQQQQSDTALAMRNKELFGDFLSLVCACGIGLYQVLYKKYAVPRDYHSLYYINFMTALLGLGTLLVCWFPIPILNAIRVELFRWPTKQQFSLILANAFFGVAYNGGFMIALALISPLFAAIGVMLTIPVTAVVDMVIQGHVLAWNVFVGGSGILAGFAMLTFAEYKDTVRKTSSQMADDSSTVADGGRTSLSVVASTIVH
ncbi:hypothetical protein GGI25_003701 [Coemansia spiralis]|uniref:EamA domain-containing protein n=1 Tax=Coemansia spiralis TaxID=417178 RepID=A0A9W8G5Y8_9FUNG|nr:hypothetical protein GGI25_003701 [Coemansia spiralis]